jgi:hypothetical protein
MNTNNMRDLINAMTANVTAGSVNESIHQLSSDDPNNPEVLVPGYGVLSLNGAIKMIADDLKKLADHAEQGNIEQVQYYLNKSPLTAKIDAVAQAMNELESIRSKGGRRSRGINRR